MQKFCSVDNSVLYSYYFNGLFVRSEIRFSEVRECAIDCSATAEQQVVIKYGKTPKALRNATYSTQVISFSATEALVHIDKTGWYYIDGNNNITVEGYEGVPEYAVRLYIFSIVLGILLHKNSIFSVHASSIKVNDGAVIIAGHSGAGKSTLALGMYLKGYQILNDDITSIYLNAQKEPMIYPGVQHLKLWSQSLEKYGYAPSSFDKLRDELDKYSFPVKRDITESVPLKAIYFLHKHDEIPLQKAEIGTGIEKIRKLRNHTYRYKLIEHLQKSEKHFFQASSIVSRVPLFDIYRSHAISPANFVDYMEEQFLAL